MSREILIEDVQALRDLLLSDVEAAKTREEHIRITARANLAETILGKLLAGNL